MYDWNTDNNEMTFTPGAAFKLSARGAGRTSVDLRWAKQAGADQYVIYSAAYDEDNSEIPFKRLAGLVTVPADTTEYHYEGLGMGEKQHYLIRARKDGLPIAMSNPVVATAEIPGQPWRDSLTPGSVGSLTAARKSGDDTTINVSWNAPSSGATGYDVQYRSRQGRSGSYGNWTGLSTQQGGTTYTFNNAGGRHQLPVPGARRQRLWRPNQLQRLEHVQHRKPGVEPEPGGQFDGNPRQRRNHHQRHVDGSHQRNPRPRAIRCNTRPAPATAVRGRAGRRTRRPRKRRLLTT